MNDDINKLYNALLNNGYKIDDLGGSEESFRESMGNAELRGQFYDWVAGREDFNIGSREAFERRMTAKPVNPVYGVIEQASGIPYPGKEIGKSQYTFAGEQLNLEEESPKGYTQIGRDYKIDPIVAPQFKGEGILGQSTQDYMTDVQKNLDARKKDYNQLRQEQGIRAGRQNVVKDGDRYYTPGGSYDNYSQAAYEADKQDLESDIKSMIDLYKNREGKEWENYERARNLGLAARGFKFDTPEGLKAADRLRGYLRIMPHEAIKALGKDGYEALKFYDNKIREFGEKDAEVRADAERLDEEGTVLQGFEGLGRGMEYVAGETLNVFTGSAIDDKEILENWDEFFKDGKLKSPQEMGFRGANEMANRHIDYAANFPPVYKDYQGYLAKLLQENDNDIEKVKGIIKERSKDSTLGDWLKTDAAEAINDFKPTAEGVGGFLAEMIPNMAGTILAIGVGALTKNPTAAKMIGYANLASMGASTAGNSMKEARDAGATNGQVWATGIADGAIEFITEKIPYDKLTGSMFRQGKKGMAAGLRRAVDTPEGQRELSELLNLAQKELGVDIFNRATAKNYLSNVAAEGLSEFSAEALQTMTKAIYASPEEYPTLWEAVQNGWEGMKGGLFMGAVLGGYATVSEAGMHDARRRKQGFVRVAQAEIGGVPVIGEILEEKKDGSLVFMYNGEEKIINKKDIKQEYEFTYDEFRTGELGNIVNNAYEEGYSQEPTGEATILASDNYQEATKRVMDTFQLSEEQEIDDMLAENSVETLANGDSQVADMLYDYKMRKAYFEGAQDRFLDTLEEQFAQSDKSIDSRANKDNPTAVYSTMYDGEQVNITGGNVVLFENGKVDYDNSSETLYVTFPDNTVKPVSAKNFTEVVTVENADELKAAARAEIDNRWRSEFDNAEKIILDGKKRKEGKLFNTSDELGEHTVEILEEGETESRILLDGKEYPISTEELNQWRNEAGVVPSNTDVETAEAEAPAVAPVVNEVAPIPMEKRGNVERAAYHLVPIERTMEDLHDGQLDQNEVQELINARIKEAYNDVQALEKKKPKEPKKPKMEGSKEAYLAAKVQAKEEFDKAQTQWQASMDEAKQRLDYYNELYTREQEITKSEIKEAYDNVQPREVIEMTANEFIANNLPKITPESFKAETGLSNSEQAEMVGYIAGADKGGVTVEQAAESIMENYGDELRSLGYSGDMQDVRDTIINILSQGNPRSYAKQGLAQRKQESIDQQRAEMETVAASLGFKSVEDMSAYEEQVIPGIIQMYTGFDYNEYYNNLAENYEYDTTRESETTGRGSELLQGEQPIDNAGTPVAEGNEGGAVSSSVPSNGTNAQASGNEQVTEPVGNSEQLSSSEIPNNQSVAEGEDVSPVEESNPLANHAENIAKRLGVNVTLHTDASTVADRDAMTAIAEGGVIKGWYNPNTGEIALFLPNMESMRDVESTILHEAVSHYGIKNLLGKEEFNKFLDAVWEMMPADARAQFLEYVGADMKNPSQRNMRAAADEYVAHIAERMDLSEVEKSIWDRILDFILARLKEAGFANLDRGDIENVIRASYRNLARNGGNSQVTGQGETMASKKISERRQEKNRINNVLDEVGGIIYGNKEYAKKQRLKREAERKQLAKEIYSSVLKGDFNDVILSQIDKFIEDATPANPFGRRISQRLPQRMERALRQGARTNAVDALFSRISESAVPANERFSEAGRREIEERKKELLKGWAIATGNWHTDLKEFTDDTEPIGEGKDSKVYSSKDGRYVIKASKGKPFGKRFRPDIDNIALFNDVFRDTRYEILGYGEIDGEFVRILQQPIVDFAESTPLTSEERREYMQSLGFEPLNDANTAFADGEIVIADLQKGNVVRDAAGNISVIDADAKLHTKDVGGDYTYPPVETDLPEGTDLSGTLFSKVFHGSGAKFDRFDHSFMGTGEGAQAFGWGTYVTEVEGIGKQYAKATSKPSFTYKGQEVDVEGFENPWRIIQDLYNEHRGKLRDMRKAADYYSDLAVFNDAKTKDLWQNVVNTLADIRAGDLKMTPSRVLYTVEIPDPNGSNYLHWEEVVPKKVETAVKERLLERLSEGQGEAYKSDLKQELDDVFRYSDFDGASLYKNISAYLGGDKQASLFLGDMGFVGISYPANATTGGRADGARNYVIFNENDAEIKDRTMFRISKTPQEFDATQAEAVEKRGIVAPGLNEAVVNVVSVPRHDFTGNLKEARSQAREWAIENYTGKEFDLPENAGKYVISKNAIGKYLDKSAFDKSENAAVHLSVLKELPNVISNSIEVEIHADYSKGDNGERSAENGVNRNDLLVHRIYGAVNIDGKTYRVKTTIHEFRDGNTANTPHSYEVTKIELIEDSTVTPNDGIDNPLNRSVNSISATKLLEGVEKSYDKGKKVLQESVMEGQTMFRRGDIPEVEQQRAKQQMLELIQPFAKEKREEEKLKDAERVINEFNRTHKGALPVRIVQNFDNWKDEFRGFGVKEDEISRFEERIKEGSGRPKGAYLPDADIIVIFDHSLKGRDLEGALWHENMHKAIRRDNRFNMDVAENVVKTYLPNDYKEFIDFLENIGYHGLNAYEEALCQIVQSLHLNGGLSRKGIKGTGVVQEYLNPLIVKIYGYGKEYGTTFREIEGDLQGINEGEIQGGLPDDSVIGGVQTTAGEEETRFSREVEEVEAGGSIDDVKTAPLTLMERITNSLLEVSAKNKENLGLRADALRAYGRDMENLLKLMRAQREYDKSTVDQLVKLAKMYFKNAQLVGEVDTYTMGRILSVINNVVGRKDISANAEKLMDILIDAHNKALGKVLAKAEKVKPKKINASGVEVIGSLDMYGQEMVESYNAGKLINGKQLNDAISDAYNNLADKDREVRKVFNLDEDTDVEKFADKYIPTGEDPKDATIEDYKKSSASVQGYELAREYVDNIQSAVKEIADLEKELKDAHMAKRKGEMSQEAYNEFRKSTMEAIFESKVGMIDAYHSLISKFSEGVRESGKRAKAFQQAQIDRVKAIQHNANSDMEGHPAKVQGKKPTRHNNAITRALMSSLGTFQTILEKFGEKAVDGKGYLYDRFMTQVTDAGHKEFEGIVAARATIEIKLKELFGKRFNTNKFCSRLREHCATISYIEGGKEHRFELTRGQALYIYMANKMTDGQMKLRKMGITEEVVASLVKELPEKMVLFADWVQDDLMTTLRGKYNAVHERLFGVSMAAIENYFPLKIRKEGIGEKNELGQDAEAKPSTITGAIIKRTKNSAALDLSADAMQVLLEHIDQMEHWAAFAEFNRDINSLINYRHFQNQVKSMTTLRYGSGDVLWENFKEVVAIATETYKPKRNKFDKAVLNITKGITRSKINFRLYTALKQFLSAPAFWNNAGVKELAFAYANPAGSIKWAMENLPGFKERWMSRSMGNEKLLNEESDWKVFRTKFVENATKWGMTPNAAVDALTVAQGARAVYLTKLRQFKDAGYSEEQAEKKALQRAAESYNESQQSSEGAYLSAMQASGTAAAAIFTTFKNSNFGYTRKTAQAVANISRKMHAGYKKETIEFMKKKMMREGLTEEQAEKFATKIYYKSLYKDVVDVALFGAGLGFLWNFGGMAIYLIVGDDDDEKDKIWEEVAIRTSLDSLNGIPFGETAINAVMAAREGNMGNIRLPEFIAFGDVKNLAKVWDTDRVKFANDLINMLLAAGVGVEAKPLTDLLVAFGDIEDWSVEEFGLFALRTISAPSSQLDRLLVDDAMENNAANLEEVAMRYIQYKKGKDTPITGWMYSDEGEQEAVKRYGERFAKYLDERLENVVEDNDTFDVFYNSSEPGVKKSLSSMRQKFLAGENADRYQKFSSRNLILDTLEVLKGNLETSVEDATYFEMTNSEDVDATYLTKSEMLKHEDVYKTWNKLEGTEKREYGRLHENELDYYKGLKKKTDGISRYKSKMKESPENAERYMTKIREKQTQAIELINNYRNE